METRGKGASVNDINDVMIIRGGVNDFVTAVFTYAVLLNTSTVGGGKVKNWPKMGDIIYVIFILIFVVTNCQGVNSTKLFSLLAPIFFAFFAIKLGHLKIKYFSHKLQTQKQWKSENKVYKVNLTKFFSFSDSRC